MSAPAGKPLTTADAVESFIDWASNNKFDNEAPFSADTIGAWLDARGLTVTTATTGLEN